MSTAVDNGHKVVLVVGSGGRLYREYLLDGVARAQPVWLLDAGESTWQRPYVVGTSVIELLDRDRLVPDVATLVRISRRLARRRRVLGVLSYDETLVIATAQIAESLELPGLTVDGADRCRNKQRCRETLTAAGIAQPRFATVFSLENARAAAGAFGYPVVLKPRGMGASIGVVRADTEGELDLAFATAERASHAGSPAYEGGVLVEELLTGPEISVDAAVQAGEYRPFCLARKRLGPKPYFEEVGHTVDAQDPLLTDPALIEMLSDAHRALGLGSGITHTEVRLTARGPVIVEVNARLGGDLIPYLGKLATGIDPGDVAVTIATGRRPSLESRLSQCVGIRFVYPPEDCVVRTIELPQPGRTPGLKLSRPMVAPGTKLALPPRAHLGRLAYLICEGANAVECERRLDQAVNAVRIEYERI